MKKKWTPKYELKIPAAACARHRGQADKVLVKVIQKKAEVVMFFTMRLIFIPIWAKSLSAMVPFINYIY
jgi:hypothetical protein